MKATDEQIAVVENRKVECLSLGNRAREYDSITAVLQELRELRAANEWVPTSERLPKKSGKVLVTRHRKADGAYIVRRVSFDVLDGFEEIRQPFNVLLDVVAWREVPKPYNPTEENNGK